MLFGVSAILEPPPRKLRIAELITRTDAAERIETPVIPVPSPSEVQPLQHDDIRARRIDRESVGTADTNATRANFAGDRDGLGDREAAESTRIQTVDLAACRGF